MAKFIYRRPPYPEYDIEGIESWLESLAAEGLMLDHNGYVFGFMQFQRHEPKKLKYRLEAIPRMNPFALKDPPDPEEKAQKFYQEFGWEYLGQFFDYYIYRSLDEDAVELNTDPALQAISLENVKRRSTVYFWISMVLAIAAGVLLLGKGRVITEIINEGWLPLTLFVIFIILYVVICLLRHLHIINLQKKLQNGKTLNRDKNWKQGLWRRRLLLSLPWLIYVGSFAANNFSVNPVVDHALDAAAYSEPLPFVTMADMAPQREYVSDTEQLLSRWYSPLSPVNYYWAEYAYLEAPEEQSWFGGVEIYYHEAANEWLAETIIEEYIDWQEQYHMYTRAPGITYNLSETGTQRYDFDYLAVYESFGGVRIFIRDKNTVIRATYSVHVWGENDYLYPLWIEMTALKLA